ncbi:hypothetical protein RD792_007257 [Penstemon davidsonii]|uniref:DOG1 domain-containing protein n=1 Tax=Penstemon davidsonii TaxID=160366 RepID=A0ABR0D5X5_9LAMI|nr:hypothetical protein RD792_007257 [Penstemon davidsonii]
MATFNHDQFQCCFQNWIAQQHEDLDELVNALSADSKITDEKLNHLCQKGIKHFEEYYEKRSLMAKHHAPSFLSPTWCSSFENAYLWIGGCRPSISVRLVYSVCGSELNDQLTEFLRGERKGNLAEISSEQLKMINALHCKTIKAEETMSTRMASLQAHSQFFFFFFSFLIKQQRYIEEIADEPLAMLAKMAGRVGESSQDLDRAMDAHSVSLASIMGDADRLRLSTLKDLVGILTPLQTVDLFVATKKLHLSMHEWGKRSDNQIGKRFSSAHDIYLT